MRAAAWESTPRRRPTAPAAAQPGPRRSPHQEVLVDDLCRTRRSCDGVATGLGQRWLCRARRPALALSQPVLPHSGPETAGLSPAMPKAALPQQSSQRLHAVLWPTRSSRHWRHAGRRRDTTSVGRASAAAQMRAARPPHIDGPEYSVWRGPTPWCPSPSARSATGL